ncbi:DNA-binding IclR family transcriptional regulator [Barrientosiimonas humi]|uniref:DNA-binding IclR family transcriptional regulator n=1 Tax=Barrientosiimonas humi TaxID=999931 RepID=A0A542XDI9_9MICO|nr:helix-turn-helix domain-containing protein [Barrientosiimonas humi]TQL33816.1 DNA-binding IclR family transcriptional regulator [Barrientosiimonas humi]CAG7573804.1 HTH-type transcriptional regulator KipR [Barrientosiimonas humi]
MSPSPESEPADLGGETSQTMDRGLALLRLLTTTRSQGATVTELATDLGVGRPVVYRLLASLAREDLVARRADGRVGPGMGLLRLAVSVRPLVVEAAVPHLRRLADTVRATAHLTLAEHGEALAVAVVEPTVSDLHVAYRVGSRHPLEAGAAGRAILLGRADRSGEDVVVTDSELQPGAHGLAAPVRGTPGLEASVGVVALHPLDPARVGPLVTSAAERISLALQ